MTLNRIWYSKNIYRECSPCPVHIVLLSITVNSAFLASSERSQTNASSLCYLILYSFGKQLEIKFIVNLKFK